MSLLCEKGIITEQEFIDEIEKVTPVCDRLWAEKIEYLEAERCYLKELEES